MRTLTALLVVVVGCGGKFDGPQPDAGNTCPLIEIGGTACASEGATCSLNTSDCYLPTSETCTCENGEWLCPEYKCGEPYGCPTGVSNGSSCTEKDLTCEISTVCGTVSCMCDGTTFNCIEPDCPEPACPPPNEIVSGEACSGPPNEICDSGTAIYDCDGNVIDYEICRCANGTWLCQGSAPICDGGAPPPADF